MFFIRIFLWENITKKFQCHNTLRHGGYLLTKDQKNSLAYFRENTNFNFCFFYPIWLHLCCSSEKLILYRLTWIMGHISKHLSTYGYKCSYVFLRWRKKSCTVPCNFKFVAEILLFEGPCFINTYRAGLRYIHTWISA